MSSNKFAAVTFLALGYGAQDCFLPVAWAVCLDVGRKYAGAVTGSMNMAGQLGSFASSVAFGYMVKYFGNYDTPLLFMGGFLLVSALLFSRLDPLRQIVPENNV
jgi:MFS transporter, ACS family, glucarate transporter